MIDFAALAAALSRRQRDEVRLPGWRAAAVLVPIVVEPGRAERLLFIVRGAGLRAHAGQIAFPGGGRETVDEDLRATALREAREELGIPSDKIVTLGMLDDVPTPSGYVVTPYVARVDGPLALVPQRSEVDDFFVAELDGLRAPGCHFVDGERTFLGVRYAMHTYRWERWTIWGATARMVHQLLGLLDGEDRVDEEEDPAKT